MAKNKEDKQKSVVCENCGQTINTKSDNYVAVSTFNRVSKPNHHAYFHFTCWVDYFNERVMRKSKDMVSFMRNQALQVANSPLILEALREVPNFDQVLKMLNIPLTDKENVEQNLKNGRTKRRKTKAQVH